jgi:hypothetical protein
MGFVLFASLERVNHIFWDCLLSSIVGGFLRNNAQGCFRIEFDRGLHYLVIAAHRFVLHLQGFGTA